MRLAYVKNHEIYGEKLLGLTLRERIEKTLQRAGFDVRFFDELTLEEAEDYLIILEPVLILERDLLLEGRKILVSDGFTVGYFFGGDFRTVFDGNLQSSIEKYLSLNNLESYEIWAIKLSNDNLKTAEKLLLSSLIKAKRTGLKPAYYDGWIAREINRKVSLRISRLLADTSVTPNQITVFSFFLSLVGSALFLLNSYLTTLLAGIIIQLHSIIDGCDGEIARLKFMESKYGAWLDGVLDRYSDFIIVFSITYVLSASNPVYWIIGFLAAFASLMIAYTGDKFVAAYMRTYSPEGFAIPITRDFRLFIIFACSVVNLPSLALVIIALLGNFEALRRIVALRSYTN
ncbi:CDP-alcohol phosphatidyltransferase family protein [Archaeoglobus sp.]|uniref:CDP-alcohol phosphatidyltransferase family protein n=1 Tax=Archaeoglobus sp. TaxID=1872626 RepID=UPI0024AB279C|nr:CDP-alcohol phosphatidyltransferase family protein [Archaeoglobus sp.]MDI3497004.1 hypothetical protein [Archaeoglobus sp.]